MAGAALVTGGSSGIGFAIARALRDDGYDVTLASRTAEKVEAAAAELGAHAVAANVARPEQCAAIVAAHRERFRRLDVLVNGAGVGVAGRVDELNPKFVGLQLDVNFRGLVLVTQAAIPLLKESRGHIFNVASIAGTVRTPGLSIYGASKAAVIAFTRTLNAELDADGVRATALAPGFVDTPMASWTGIPREQMIQTDDCVELVRAVLRLSPYARVPEIVVERVGALSDSVPG